MNKKVNSHSGDIFILLNKSLLLSMRILTLLLFIGLTTLNASTSSAQKKIDIKIENGSYVDFFKTIETKSKFVIFYKDDVINTSIKLTIDLKESTISQILDRAFKNTNIGYTIIGRQIVIKRKDSVSIPKSDIQDYIKISGTVSDNDGSPLPGASIVEKGSANGVQTDFDGNYQIIVKKGATLIISYVGFFTQEIPAGSRSSINVSMAVDTGLLDEVVVVGYGSQLKRKVTSAISSVDAEEIAHVPVTGLDQAIQGRMAGVQVTQNSGAPGGSVSLRIRGVGSINSSNEPLYIVDGVPFSSLNSINPNDIQRIDVLKDAASASIYGSRASNGVVLVTTKRGREGKLEVSIDLYSGMQNAYKTIDLLNGPDFARLANENLVNGGIAPNPAWSNPSVVLNNDWQDAVLRAAPIHNVNMAISSGNKKSSIFFSTGYFNQEGIVVGSDYERYTARLNADFNIRDNFKLGVTLNGSFENTDNVGNQDSYDGVLQTASIMQPTSLIRTNREGYFGLNPDGSINPNDGSYFGWEGYAFTSARANPNYYPTGANNPLHVVQNDYVTHNSESQQLLASVFAEYEMFSGFKLRSSASFTVGNDFNTSSLRQAPLEINNVGQNRSVPTYDEGWSKSYQKDFINTISYDKIIGKHSVGVIVGIDVLEGSGRFVNVSTAGAPESQQIIDASDISSRVVSGYPTNYSLLSYFGRFTYDYGGKYLLSASIRRDGSSKFGPNNKFGTFPSVSVGWLMSEENFMNSSDFINLFKLRASYGEVGNQNIGDFLYLSTYSNGGGNYQYTLNEIPVNAFYPDNIGDPDLHWEKSIQTNLGLDFAILQNKFTLSVDYYIKTLDDLLGYFPVPEYTGVNGGAVLRNGFSMENRGLEMALGYHQKVGNVNFSTNANFSTLNNKILKLTEDERNFIATDISASSGVINDGGAQTRTAVGERIGTFYGFMTDGIIQNQQDVDNSGLGGVSLGDRKYKDMNGDGQITGADRVALGNGLPKYTFGINLAVNYKGFDFSVLLNGQAGVEIANMNNFALYNMRFNNSTGIVNGSADLVNSWTGPGSTNRLPRNSYTAPTSNRWFSDFSVEDGSFVRVRNVQLGYAFPEQLVERIGLSKFRVYTAVQNLYTFTKYSGYDPEIGSSNSNVLKTGVDFGRYPLSRMLTLGLNCSF